MTRQKVQRLSLAILRNICGIYIYQYSFYIPYTTIYIDQASMGLIDLPEALLAEIFLFYGRHLRTWAITPVADMREKWSPEVDRQKLLLASMLSLRTVCKTWNRILCSSCEELELSSMCLTVLPTVQTSPKVFSIAFPKLRRLVIHHDKLLEDFIRKELMKEFIADGNEPKIITSDYLSVIGDSSMYVSLNKLFEESVKLCRESTCVDLQILISGICVPEDQSSHSGNNFEDSDLEEDMVQYSMIKDILTYSKEFLLCKSTIGCLDLSNNTALLDNTVRQIFSSNVAIQNLVICNCSKLHEPIVYSGGFSNVIKLFVDGCWRISDTNITAFRNVISIDILDSSTISEVVIINGHHTGRWVRCDLLRQGIHDHRTTGLLPTYDIYVHVTTDYDDAIGFSGREAHNISRKHLRCAKKLVL